MIRLTLFLAMFASPALAGGATCAADKVIFHTDDAPTIVTVEVAATDASRERGLMFRKTLPSGNGMIFVYPDARPVSFWMRNTLIPLDLLFIDETGVVRHIHKNARPLDETSIPGATKGDSDPARLLVVELPAGDVDRFGLREGSTVSHPAVPQKLAVAPCAN